MFPLFTQIILDCRRVRGEWTNSGHWYQRRKPARSAQPGQDYELHHIGKTGHQVDLTDKEYCPRSRDDAVKSLSEWLVGVHRDG